MAFWSYHRKFHLIFLLVLLCMYLLDRVMFAVMYGFLLEIIVSGIYWDLSCVLFLILWLLRGMASTRCLFPWFHFASLLFEWLMQIVFFGFLLYFAAKYSNFGYYYNEAYKYVEFIYYIGSNLLVALIYLLILFK